MFRHVAVVALVACSTEDPIDLAVEAPGPNSVGTARFEVHDDALAERYLESSSGSFGVKLSVEAR